MGATASNAFDRLYAEQDDPWHIESPWYERRKRAVLLAALPFEQVDTIYEPGCGNGALSAGLANRCRRLLVSDTAPRALVNARQRMAECNNVEFACETIPAQWPAEMVDCIILSELGYYLDPPALDLLVQKIQNCLKPAGFLVACHWKPAFAERTCGTAQLHLVFEASLSLTRLVHHDEHDFLLDVWSTDGRSVAAREGML